MPKDGSTKTSEPGITKHKRKGGLTYRVRLSGIDASGAPASVDKSFPTFELARDFKRKAIHELRAGIYQEPSTERLADHLARWLKAAKLADNSRTTYGRIIDRIVVPALGAVELGRLTPERIQTLYDVPRGASEAIQLQAVMRGALDYAVTLGLMPRNVAAGLRVARRDEAPREPPIWTATELQTFLAAVESHWLADLYHVAAYTGLRISELVNLTWDDITMDLGRLFVRQAKTRAGVRRVALDAETVARLRRRLADQTARRRDAGDAWIEHNRVFERGDGTPVSVRTAEEVMARYVTRLGLPPATPHTLRHVHSAMLLRAGVPLNVVQRRLGHASAATTATIYGRWIPDDERDAADAFANAVCRTIVETPAPLRKSASD